MRQKKQKVQTLLAFMTKNFNLSFVPNTKFFVNLLRLPTKPIVCNKINFTPKQDVNLLVNLSNFSALDLSKKSNFINLEKSRLKMVTPNIKLKDLSNNTDIRISIDNNTEYTKASLNKVLTDQSFFLTQMTANKIEEMIQERKEKLKKRQETFSSNINVNLSDTTTYNKSVMIYIFYILVLLITILLMYYLFNI